MIPALIPSQPASQAASAQSFGTNKLTAHLPAGGGHPTTTNRTYWPTTGGAIAFQPGWFQGHATAFLYINMGFGTDGPDNGPWNMSFPMVPPFQILGPSKNPYPGTVCLPQVPLPANTTVSPGDNATIQVVELAVHGASLFSVSSSLSGSERLGKSKTIWLTTNPSRSASTSPSSSPTTSASAS